MRTVLFLWSCVQLAYLPVHQPMSLTLYAENPGPREWNLGDTIRLSYVVETSSDTQVSCTRDGRLLSSYVISVPTKTVSVRVRRVILVRNATVSNAGRYLCRITRGNVSRTVGWRVKIKAPGPCRAGHTCHESIGGTQSCTPCGCPVGRSFFGRNRMYRCYDHEKTFKLDVKASSRDYVFRTHDAVAIDYKISTFADTQVSWLVDNVIQHTHTQLFRGRHGTMALFRKRLFLDGLVQPGQTLDGVLEVSVRGTEIQSTQTISVTLSRSVLWSPCEGQNCTVINAVCSPSDRCECPDGWSESRGVCRKHCHFFRDCRVLGPSSACRDHECDCSRGFVMKDRRCVPQQCERDADCSPKHGPLSTCRDNHCSCLVGHVMTDDVCGPVSCLTDVECTDAGTRCVGGECACSGDFDLVGQRCRKSEVGECSSRVPCSKDHAECRENRCFCLSGYRAIVSATACLRVFCEAACNISHARCVNGMCLCPGLKPPSSNACLLFPPLDPQELLTSVKLVICCLGLVAGIVVFTAVSLTFLKNKAGFYLASSIESHKADDDDEGTIVTAATPEDDAVTLQLDRSQGHSQAEGQDEGLPTIFFRALFPTLSGGLFGEPADQNRISFGNTQVSGSTIDI